MDKIQKTLIKAGRKDLAQEYFNRVAKKIIASSDYTASEWVEQVEIILKKIHTELDRIKKEKAIHAGSESGLKHDMKFLMDWWKELDKGLKEG
jgi:hypothetical protein